MRRGDLQEVAGLLRDLDAYDAWMDAKPEASMSAITADGTYSPKGLPPLMLDAADAQAVVKTLAARCKNRLFELGVYNLEPEVPGEPAAAPTTAEVERLLESYPSAAAPPPELADTPPVVDEEGWPIGGGRGVL